MARSSAPPPRPSCGRRRRAACSTWICGSATATRSCRGWRRARRGTCWSITRGAWCRACSRVRRPPRSSWCGGSAAWTAARSRWPPSGSTVTPTPAPRTSPCTSAKAILARPRSSRRCARAGCTRGSPPRWPRSAIRKGASRGSPAALRPSRGCSLSSTRAPRAWSRRRSTCGRCPPAKAHADATACGRSPRAKGRAGGSRSSASRAIARVASRQRGSRSTRSVLGWVAASRARSSRSAHSTRLARRGRPRSSRRGWPRGSPRIRMPCGALPRPRSPALGLSSAATIVAVVTPLAHVDGPPRARGPDVPHDPDLHRLPSESPVYQALAAALV